MPHRSLLLTLIAIAMPLLGSAASPAPATARPDADGWVSLVNGRDFTGWTFDVLDGSAPESIWRVEDGIVIVRGAGKSSGLMRTVEAYGEYELSFEWRWPAKPGNSGCLIHTSTPRELDVWPRSIEVQLFTANAGDLIHIGETIETTEAQVPRGDIQAWEVRRRYKLVHDQERAPGEWNEMRIIARGDTVEVFVNGTLVNRGWNCTATRGAIALQSEQADIHFRNVRLRPLR